VELGVRFERRELSMGAVMISCPVTGTPVSTGIETDQSSLDLTPPFESRIKCPACGGEHVWSKHDIWINEPPPLANPHAA
jgi:hypothetical protein